MEIFKNQKIKIESLYWDKIKSRFAFSKKFRGKMIQMKIKSIQVKNDEDFQQMVNNWNEYLTKQMKEIENFEKCDKSIFLLNLDLLKRKMKN